MNDGFNLVVQVEEQSIQRTDTMRTNKFADRYDGDGVCKSCHKRKSYFYDDQEEKICLSKLLNFPAR